MRHLTSSRAGSYFAAALFSIVWSAVAATAPDYPADVTAHFGGGLGFGLDNMLYLAVGDHFRSLQAQAPVLHLA